MSIYDTRSCAKTQAQFKPTWLYVKQHNVTGLKYFGKTVRSDPYLYMGSGVKWRAHLTEFGNNVSTIWVRLFETKDELMSYALQFSLDNNIVESNEWANLVIENGKAGGGVTGANKGRKLSEKTKAKMRKPKTEEHKLAMSKALTGRVMSSESREKMSKSRIGKKLKPHTEEAKQLIRSHRHSAETKAKISEASKSKRHSNETKEKIRNANLGRRLSQETKDKISAARKARSAK